MNSFEVAPANPPEAMGVLLTVGDRHGTAQHACRPDLRGMRTVHRIERPMTTAEGLLQLTEWRVKLSIYIEIVLQLGITIFITVFITQMDGVSNALVFIIVPSCMTIVHLLTVTTNWIWLGFVGGLTKYLWLNLSVNTVVLLVPAMTRLLCKDCLANPKDCQNAYARLLTFLETFNFGIMIWFGLLLPFPNYFQKAGKIHCQKNVVGCVLAYLGFALAVPDLLGRSQECAPEGGYGLTAGIIVAIILTIGMALELLSTETNCASSHLAKPPALFRALGFVSKQGSTGYKSYVTFSLAASSFIPLLGLAIWAILHDRRVTIYKPEANGVGIFLIVMGSIMFHKFSVRIQCAAAASREQAQISFERVLEQLREIPDGQESTLALDKRLRLASRLLRGVSLFSVLDSMTEPKDFWRKWLPFWAGGRKQMLDALTKAFSLSNNDATREDLSDGALSRANLYNEEAVPLDHIDGFVSYNWDTRLAESGQRARQLEEVLTDAVGDIGRYACWTMPLWVDKFSSPQTGIAFEQARRFGFFFMEYLALCPRAFVLLSPQYFLRLWCRYEYVTFLAMHDPRNMYIGIAHFLECGAPWEEYEMSIRTGSVANSQCRDPVDKATLHKLIDANYKSHEQLDRLVQFSAIALTARALLVQYSPVSRAAFQSILQLAGELRFQDLRDDLERIHSIVEKTRSLATFCKFGHPPRTLLNGVMNRLFDEQIMGTLRVLQEDALLEGSPLRKLAEEFGRLSADNDTNWADRSGTFGPTQSSQSSEAP